MMVDLSAVSQLIQAGIRSVQGMQLVVDSVSVTIVSGGTTVQVKVDVDGLSEFLRKEGDEIDPKQQAVPSEQSEESEESGPSGPDFAFYKVSRLAILPL